MLFLHFIKNQHPYLRNYSTMRSNTVQLESPTLTVLACLFSEASILINSFFSSLVHSIIIIILSIEPNKWTLSSRNTSIWATVSTRLSSQCSCFSSPLNYLFSNWQLIPSLLFCFVGLLIQHCLCLHRTITPIEDGSLDTRSWFHFFDCFFLLLWYHIPVCSSEQLSYQ